MRSRARPTRRRARGASRLALAACLALCLALAAAACSPASAPAPSPTPSPAPTSDPAPSPTAAPTTFSAARAQALVAELAALGPREATSPAYTRAAEIVRDRLRTSGYRARLQRFEVPAGEVDDIEAPAGTSVNVVATPPGFRPRAPHLVVGAHLDSVPDSPGANDNASGVAVLVELARLAANGRTRLPVVFVALGAEERRRSSPSSSVITVGADAYLDALGARERGAIAGYLNLDMVGNGPRVVVIGEGGLFRHTLARARRLGVPTSLTTTGYYSDHLAFDARGIEVAWLWAGDHASLHTPGDVASVVKRGALRRAGTLAWDVIRTYRA